MADDIAKKIELRKAIKKKKPRFLRQEVQKNKKLDKKWRRPKGIQSKARLNRKGHRKSVSHGFGSPAEVKNLTREGLVPVLVESLLNLKLIDPKKQGVVIGGSVGKRKKIMIIEEAKKLSLKLLNIKDPDASVEKIKNEIKARKEKRIRGRQEKEDKKKKAVSKKESEGKEEKSELSDEEKKEQEKKEKDKLLTQRE